MAEFQRLHALYFDFDAAVENTELYKYQVSIILHPHSEATPPVHPYSQPLGPEPPEPWTPERGDIGALHVPGLEGVKYK